MPRKTSKSTISNSTRSTTVNSEETVIVHFLYTRLAKNGSPAGMKTEKGFKNFYTNTESNFNIRSYKGESSHWI